MSSKSTKASLARESTNMGGRDGALVFGGLNQDPKDSFFMKKTVSSSLVRSNTRGKQHSVIEVLCSKIF